MGQTVQWMLGDAVDARMIDHFVTSYTSGLGRAAQTLSNAVASEKGVSTAEAISHSGITASDPATNSQSYREAVEKGRKLGLMRQKKYFSRLNGLRKEYYKEDTGRGRSVIARKLRTEARRVLKLMESETVESVKRRRSLRK